MVKTDRELWERGACATVMLRARALAAGQSESTQQREGKAASASERSGAPRVESPTASGAAAESSSTAEAPNA
jgi:hypothetical protein